MRATLLLSFIRCRTLLCSAPAATSSCSPLCDLQRRQIHLCTVLVPGVAVCLQGPLTHQRGMSSNTAMANGSWLNCF